MAAVAARHKPNVDNNFLVIYLFFFVRTIGLKDFLDAKGPVSPIVVAKYHLKSNGAISRSERRQVRNS